MQPITKPIARIAGRARNTKRKTPAQMHRAALAHTEDAAEIADTPPQALAGAVFSGPAPPAAATDRKFNRMRPSMARVLGLETRSAKEASLFA